MKIASTAVIVKDGLILSVCRRHSFKYGLPGGKCDVGETPKQAMIREVFEETGLTVNQYEFIWKRTEKSDITNDHYDCFVYYVNDYSGDIKSSEEGKVEWITFDLLISEEHGAFPDYNKLTLNKLKQLKPDLYLK